MSIPLGPGRRQRAGLSGVGAGVSTGHMLGQGSPYQNGPVKRHIFRTLGPIFVSGQSLPLLRIITVSHTNDDFKSQI